MKIIIKLCHTGGLVTKSGLMSGMLTNWLSPVEVSLVRPARWPTKSKTNVDSTKINGTGQGL